MEISCLSKSSSLAEKIATELDYCFVQPRVQRFGCGEIKVSFQKDMDDVVVIASVLTNEDWMELFFILDALRNAHSVILCFSYLGYARQDDLNKNESTGCFALLRLLENFNVSTFIFLDPHNEISTRKKSIILSTDEMFIQDINKKYKDENLCIVSPDFGRAKVAQNVASALKTEICVCSKKRNVFGHVTKTSVLGDVRKKTCILLDDIVDSGETLCHSSRALFDAGAAKVVAYVTHGVLSDKALERLDDSNIAEVTLTDSVSDGDIASVKFKRISVVPLLVGAIRCLL
ncbi:MAG: ribose-phosphate pyrophosphokinase [Alphaproteobacteria bacterium]|nr:ribose-phosphate pyrophosphokinase [Alphaproteobacteria bacterium]